MVNFNQEDQKAGTQINFSNDDLHEVAASSIERMVYLQFTKKEGNQRVNRKACEIIEQYVLDNYPGTRAAKIIRERRDEQNNQKTNN